MSARYMRCCRDAAQRGVPKAGCVKRAPRKKRPNFEVAAPESRWRKRKAPNLTQISHSANCNSSYKNIFTSHSRILEIVAEISVFLQELLYTPPCSPLSPYYPASRIIRCTPAKLAYAPALSVIVARTRVSMNQLGTSLPPPFMHYTTHHRHHYPRHQPGPSHHDHLQPPSLLHTCTRVA